MKIPDNSKYSDERLRRICQALQHGATLRAAAYSNGVGKSAVYEWMAENPDVADAIARARAEAEMQATQAITQPWSDPDADARVKLDAARFFLERRYPGEWGQKVDISKIPIDTLYALVGLGEDDDTPSIQDLRRQALLATADAQDPTDVEPNDPQGGGDGRG